MSSKKVSTASAVGTHTDRQFVTSLARGLEVLRCFTADKRMLGTTEISHLTGLPQPTVWRLTHTLVKLGYLIFHPASEQLSIGPGAMSLGYAAAVSTGVSEFASPLLEDICRRFDVTASLGANHGLNMVIMQRAENMNAVRLSLHVGSTLSLGGSTLGAAYLCGLTPDRRDETLNQLRTAAPDRWPMNKAFIADALTTHSRYGYVLNLGHSNASVNSIGVPIAAPGKTTVLAISCGGPTSIASSSHLSKRVAPVMHELAQQLAPLLDTGLRP